MWRKNYLKEVYFSILKINLFIFKISFNKHYKYLLCCCCCLVTKSWLTLAIPWTIALHAPLSMGFPRRRILEWVVISFSRGSSQPRDQICVSCIGSADAECFCLYLQKNAWIQPTFQPTMAVGFSVSMQEFLLSIFFMILQILRKIRHKLGKWKKYYNPVMVKA